MNDKLYLLKIQTEVMWGNMSSIEKVPILLNIFLIAFNLILSNWFNSFVLIGISIMYWEIMSWRYDPYKCLMNYLKYMYKQIEGDKA